MRFDTGATITVGSIYLSKDNAIAIQGDYSTGTSALSFFSGVTLFVRANDSWTTLTIGNFSSLANANYDSLTGYTSLTAAAIPEPTTAAALAGLATLAIVAIVATRRRRT